MVPDRLMASNCTKRSSRHTFHLVLTSSMDNGYRARCSILHYSHKVNSYMQQNYKLGNLQCYLCLAKKATQKVVTISGYWRCESEKNFGCCVAGLLRMDSIMNNIILMKVRLMDRLYHRMIVSHSVAMPD